MEKHDVVVVGGGHNGLVVAAYLAKAGLDVCVVERQDKVGGGVVTREVTLPGFQQDICSTQHGTIQANPLIRQDELGLVSKYGLKYIIPDIQYVFILLTIAPWLSTEILRGLVNPYGSSLNRMPRPIPSSANIQNK